MEADSLFRKGEKLNSFGPGGQTPPEGCDENRTIRPDGTEHVTRWTPDFRRSVDIKPDGSLENDHIGPNAGIGHDRLPFSSPYDQWDPRR